MKKVLVIPSSGRIYGTGAYEKGAVKKLPVFEEAYKAGKKA